MTTNHPAVIAMMRHLQQVWADRGEVSFDLSDVELPDCDFHQDCYVQGGTYAVVRAYAGGHRIDVRQVRLDVRL